MSYYCEICGKKFTLWKFWQKVKYENIAKTIRLPDGSEGTYYYKRVYHPNCLEKLTK